jgi:hypothetical protein
MQGGLQELEIIDRGLFGQLDDDLAGRNAEILQELQGTTGLVRRFEQGFGRHVEEQFAR